MIFGHKSSLIVAVMVAFGLVLALGSAGSAHAGDGKSSSMMRAAKNHAAKLKAFKVQELLAEKKAMANVSKLMSKLPVADGDCTFSVSNWQKSLEKIANNDCLD